MPAVGTRGDTEAGGEARLVEPHGACGAGDVLQAEAQGVEWSFLGPGAGGGLLAGFGRQFRHLTAIPYPFEAARERGAGFEGCVANPLEVLPHVAVAQR